MPTPPAPPPPPPPPGTPPSPAIQVANAATYDGGGGVNLNGGDNDTITLSGGGNTVSVHDHSLLTINGGGNTVTLHDNDTLVIDDWRTEADGFVGAVNFGDAITGHNGDTITLNYSLSLGDSDTVTVGWTTTLSGVGPNTSFTANGVVNAGNHDVITLSGSGEAVTLNAAGGDTLSTTGASDTITIGNSATANSSASTGGACSNGIVITIGQTAAGTTINGGLGTDTFSAGSGYDGGNHYIGSTGSYAQLFSGAGNCVNYSGLACRVTVNYQTGTGQGFDARGHLLWTDTYTNMEQVKGAQLNGNVLTGSNTQFNELKGGLGQTTYYDGAAGDRIVWSEAGATGLLDGQGTDVAHLGRGLDELYWRNQPNNSKGVGNFGETVYGFSTAQGDDLNFSEMADSGFAGVTTGFDGGNANLFDWVNVTMAANGLDTDVWFDKSGGGNFTQVAAVLKNTNLFASFGVADHSAAGEQQVVQDMYNAGNLVLNQTH